MLLFLYKLLSWCEHFSVLRISSSFMALTLGRVLSDNSPLALRISTSIQLPACGRPNTKANIGVCASLCIWVMICVHFTRCGLVLSNACCLTTRVTLDVCVVSWCVQLFKKYEEGCCHLLECLWLWQPSLSTQELLSHAGCLCHCWAGAVSPRRFAALRVSAAVLLLVGLLLTYTWVFSMDKTAPCW